MKNTKIICATNMPFAREAFSRLGEVEILPPREITPDRVKDAEILAIRSTTKANRDLLEGSRVRFVGTATIGTDHMDMDYFRQAGIHWCSAAGCNANSVAEYVTAALLRLAVRHNFTLAGRTIAIIGVGNVGRRVKAKMQALGVQVLQNDPPLAESTGDPSFRPLDEILSRADIVTMHTPLTSDGPHPTRHMVNADFLAKLKPGAIFINAARGGIHDSDALLNAIRNGLIKHNVLDTWEKEPVFRPDVLRHADFGTPHIAGHSFEGKVMGTVMVYREACRFLDVEPDWDHEPLLPPPLVPEIELAGRDSQESILEQAITRIYDIAADDSNMRKIAVLPDAERGSAFENLRQNYPVRREFRYTRIKPDGLDRAILQKLAALDFIVDE